MRIYRPNARGDLPGPGDQTPPEPDELAPFYLDEALELQCAGDPDGDWTTSSQEVIDLAWELQELARQRSLDDAADLAADVD